jgi:hypothetical protein
MSFASSCPNGLPRFPRSAGHVETEVKLEVKFEESTQAIEDCLLNWTCSGLLCPGDLPHVSICPTICSDRRRKKPIGNGVMEEKKIPSAESGHTLVSGQVMEANQGSPASCSG